MSSGTGKSRRYWKKFADKRKHCAPGFPSFIPTDRMLKKSASFVLASFRGSTYGAEYASPLRSLRPCWTAFLTILQEIVIRFETFHGCVLSPRK